MLVRIACLTAVVAALAGSLVATGQQAAQPLPETTALSRDDLAKLPPGADFAHLFTPQEIVDKDDGRGTGPSVFLIKAPTGQTLAVSRYFQVAGLDLADPPAGALKSWTVRSTPPLALGREVIPTELCQSTGIMMCRASGPAPANLTVLPVAAKPPVPRSPGLLIVPNDPATIEKGGLPTTVYGVQFVGPDSHNRPGIFCIGLLTRVKPTELVGGVVVGDDCKVVGVFHSYYPESCHDNVVIGAVVDIHTLLDAAKLPTEAETPAKAPPAKPNRSAAGPASPATAPVTAKAPAAPAATKTPAAPADPAAKALRVARMYESSEQYPMARTKLKAIIDTYPGSAAATEAKADLAKIQGK